MTANGILEPCENNMNPFESFVNIQYLQSCDRDIKGMWKTSGNHLKDKHESQVKSLVQSLMEAMWKSYLSHVMWKPYSVSWKPSGSLVKTKVTPGESVG
jgi:hypothetical protein